jgi:hypothetical protein
MPLYALEKGGGKRTILGIERRRWRGIEVVAAAGESAASSSALAAGRNTRCSRISDGLASVDLFAHSP